jgi:hypothetical protein
VSSEVGPPKPPSDEVVIAWVRRSTSSQGLPEMISDPEIILALARLLAIRSL